MNRMLLLVTVALILATCKNKSTVVENPQHTNFLRLPTLLKQQIILLPFCDLDTNLAKSLKNKLESRLNAVVTIQQSEDLPKEAYYISRKRYIADSLLVFLKHHKGDNYDKILGVTSKDISTRKNSHANWGVMGLGYCPGEACVVSAYRVRKTSRNRQHFEERMLVLAMHELGHTYSLPHCENDPCIMRDAEGKMNLDNGKNYCSSCQKSLQKLRVLK